MNNIKIIEKKEFKKFSIFLLISGLGALWLTFWWTIMIHNHWYNWGNGVDGIDYLLSFYHFCNSLLLILIAFSIRFKKFVLFSCFSVLLGFSVFASFFWGYDPNLFSFSILANLFSSHDIFYDLLNIVFFRTIFLGISFGGLFGGFILVPMFLISVYKSFIYAIKYSRGKLEFNLVEIEKLPQAETETLINNNIPIKKESSRNIFHLLIPIAGIGYVFIPFFSFIFEPNLQLIKDNIFSIILLFSFLSLSILSLCLKDKIKYTLINIFIILILFINIFIPLLFIFPNIINILNLISLILALEGIYVAWRIYREKHSKKPMVCLFNTNCQSVLESKYANIKGIGLEYFGLFYYFILALGYAFLFNNFLKFNIENILVLLVVFGFLFSVYLIFIQKFIIKNWCSWCLSSALTSTLLLLVVIFKFLI
jgi:uncharacterized membrane protein